MSTDETIIEGVGNVFDDLGMPDAAAELVKAQLTFQIAKRIKALGLTQTAAAARLGISQPDVSRLMKRRPTGFSTDRLLALLTALDIDVDIVLRPASAPAHSAKVSIREELPQQAIGIEQAGRHGCPDDLSRSAAAGRSKPHPCPTRGYLDRAPAA